MSRNGGRSPSCAAGYRAPDEASQTGRTKDMRYDAKDIQNAREVIRKLPSTIYAIYEPSKSGMSRRIRFYWADAGDICGCTYVIATVLGLKVARDGSVRVHGCGMDMGFATYYEARARADVENAGMCKVIEL